MIGLFFTGAYILKGIKHVLHGPTNARWVGHITEINSREIFIMVPLMVLILWIGVWPGWILNVINAAMNTMF
jgi:NADH-quinone oxidoreductase subunit M